MKGKKSSKKSAKSSFITFDTQATSRAIIGLLMVMLAASIFLLFKVYEQNIIANNMFYPFIILTFIGMGLLIALLFLINPSHPKKK